MSTTAFHLNLAGAAAALVAAAAATLGATAAAAPAQPDCRTATAGRQITVPVLMYHRVNRPRPGAGASERGLTVAPADFARQMEWLSRRGYTTIAQRDLHAALFCGRPLAPKPILITFDDGYRDTFFRASPVLKRLRMRATAYVVSGRISGRDPSFLTWPLLRALERRGIEIGSHTVTHRDLTRLSDRDALRELVRSRRTLEERLGHPVPWLAYPFGSHDRRVVRLARRAGYALAVTTRPGARHSAAAPLELRRIRVLDTTGVAGLAALLGER